MEKGKLKIVTYEEIDKDLKNVVNEYIKLLNDRINKQRDPYNYRSQETEVHDFLKEFILNERKASKEDRLENRLIEVPTGTNLEKYFRQSYCEKAEWLSGELCCTNDNTQLDEISCLSLLMLLSNRIQKEKKIQNISKSEPWSQQKNQKEYYKKNEALTNLIASLYVISKTEDGYGEYFSYGEFQDNNQKYAFVIDLPYYGQISVHFGNARNHDVDLEQSRDKAKSILKRKAELGLINGQTRDKLINELDNNNSSVIPKYTGRLYEFASGIPFEFAGNRVKNTIKRLGFSTFDPEKMNHDDMLKICQSHELNDRERYYLAIKMGFPKYKLEELLSCMKGVRQKQQNQQAKLDTKKIGSAMLSETTPEERLKIKETEKREIGKENDSIYKG